MSNVKVVSFFFPPATPERLQQATGVSSYRLFSLTLYETGGHLSKTDTKKRPQRSPS